MALQTGPVSPSVVFLAAIVWKRLKPSQRPFEPGFLFNQATAARVSEREHAFRPLCVPGFDLIEFF